MALRFEYCLTQGIAQISYLIGDTDTGTAAVIDPRPDVDVYLEMAQKHKLSITHILETHIHADFVSGARELAYRSGTAKIYLSHEGGAKYGYEHMPLKNVDTFEFGKTILQARHTPGHTPEHMSYVLAQKEHPDSPWGVLSGDSLFVDSVGRPDLLGDEQSKILVAQLYDTLYGFYLKELGDHVIVYPCHGQGSPCGSSIGDRQSSTIGYERRFNRFLQSSSKEDFEKQILSQEVPIPRYYPRMKKVNAQGPEIRGANPIVPGLPPKEFEAAMRKEGAMVIDTRHMLAFGGGHIQGAINIGARPELSLWAGWMLDPDTPLFLVLHEDSDLSKVIPLFLRSGYQNLVGYLAGGMTKWENQGLPMQKLPQMTVHELKESASEVQLLDVRSPEEWKKGYIPGAHHKFAPEFKDKVEGLDSRKTTVSYCDSGFRSNIVASILQARGFQDVRSVPGSWQAWNKAGYPIENLENKVDHES